MPTITRSEIRSRIQGLSDEEARKELQNIKSNFQLVEDGQATQQQPVQPQQVTQTQQPVQQTTQQPTQQPARQGGTVSTVLNAAGNVAKEFAANKLLGGTIGSLFKTPQGRDSAGKLMSRMQGTTPGGVDLLQGKELEEEKAKTSESSEIRAEMQQDNEPDLLRRILEKPAEMSSVGRQARQIGAGALKLAKLPASIGETFLEKAGTPILGLLIGKENAEEYAKTSNPREALDEIISTIEVEDPNLYEKLIEEIPAFVAGDKGFSKAGALFSKSLSKFPKLAKYFAPTAKQVKAGLDLNKKGRVIKGSAEMLGFTTGERLASEGRLPTTGEAVGSAIIGGAFPLGVAAGRGIKGEIKENVMKFFPKTARESAMNFFKPRAKKISKVNPAELDKKVEAMDIIRKDAPNIKIKDIDGIERQFIPAEANEFELAQALVETKKNLFESFTKIAKESEAKGGYFAAEDLEALEKWIKDYSKKKGLIPEEAGKLNVLQQGLETFKIKVKEEGGEKIIKEFEDATLGEVQSYLSTLAKSFKSLDDKAGQDVVNGFVIKLKEQLEGVINRVSGNSKWSELRKQYSLLKGAEDDVLVLAKKFMKDHGATLGLAEKIGAVELFTGAVSGNLLNATRGLGVILAKVLSGQLTSKTRFLKKIFTGLEEAEIKAAGNVPSELKKVLPKKLEQEAPKINKVTPVKEAPKVDKVETVKEASEKLGYEDSKLLKEMKEAFPDNVKTLKDAKKAEKILKDEAKLFMESETNVPEVIAKNIKFSVRGRDLELLKSGDMPTARKLVDDRLASKNLNPKTKKNLIALKSLLNELDEIEFSEIAKYL